MAERISGRPSRESHGIVDGVGEELGHEPRRGDACRKSREEEPAESFDGRIPLFVVVEVEGRGGVGESGRVIHARLDSWAWIQFATQRARLFLFFS